MKKFKFEIKEFNENDGTFKGIASMYGNIDLGGDIVESGAFTKTLKEKKTVPILWQHKTDMPIGLGSLEDTENSLIIDGQLNLETEKGREAYSLIKQGAIKGLSIGYDVIKEKWEKGIRHLKELKLWEISVVTFPMNILSNIVSIKSEMVKGYDLESTYKEEELRHKIYRMFDLLDTTIRNITNSNELELDEKINLIDNALGQFHILYLSGLKLSLENGTKMDDYIIETKMLNSSKGTETDKTAKGILEEGSKSEDNNKIEEESIKKIFEEMKQYNNKEEK